MQAVILRMLDLMIMMMLNVTDDCDNGDCGDDDEDCGVGDCGDDGVVVRAAAAVVQAKQSERSRALQHNFDKL